MVNRLFFMAFLMALLASAPAGAIEVESVVIDPGHGGYDTGIKVENHSEKDIIQDIAREVEVILRTVDREVYLTRRMDQYVLLEDRSRFANSQNPDLFLSIHLSATDSFTVYVQRYEDTAGDIPLKEYYSVKSRQRRYLYESGVFAGTMEEILRNTFDADVLHRELPLPVLGHIGAPSALVEVPYAVLAGKDYEREIMRVASALAISIMYYGQ